MKIHAQMLNSKRVLVSDPTPSSDGAPTIFLMHGLGTNAEDLAPLIGELDLPHCRFVLPDAPMRLNGYPPGALAWYDFETPDRAGVEKSRDHLLKLMDHFVGLSPGKTSSLLMTGFSQGGVMALEAGLAWKGGATAIVSMSGYLPHPKEAVAGAHASKKIPILMVHGTYDGVVPVQGSREAAATLKAAGFHPVFREFEMEHTISEESLEEVRQFLHRVLGA
jgi:phospholipase/carboxylesterase